MRVLMTFDVEGFLSKRQLEEVDLRQLITDAVLEFAHVRDHNGASAYMDKNYPEEQGVYVGKDREKKADQVELRAFVARQLGHPRCVEIFDGADHSIQGEPEEATG